MTPNHATSMASPPLPVAGSERWQPIRGGLLNLYRFDYEEFRYENGHLLLRGNNGTGKSRVLALQLPFLLDGEVAPHRLEPDGDPAKNIEWNLLLNKHADRLGYTWIEFGRRDDDGGEHFLTLGCGLHAVSGRGLVSRWFFVTHQRVGQDLFLQADAGHALTKSRLIETIGDAGEVFTTARDYRFAVDRALFKLGPHRYGALIDLLIQLRHPQLSRNLDERKLSSALSEALAPVSAGVLGDVAEAFRNLESDRVAVEDYKAASQGTEAFLREYRQYTKIAACRRATAVRKAHSAYENAMRRLRASEKDRDKASEDLAEVIRLLEQLSLEEHAAQAAVDTLRGDPAMRTAEELDVAFQMAKERQADVESALTELQRAESNRELAVDDRLAADRRAAESSKKVQSKSEEARRCADAVGLEQDHCTAMEMLDLENLEDPDEAAASRALLEEAASKRREASRLIQKRNDELHEAEQGLAKAKHAQTELASQLDEAVDAHQARHQALIASADALIQSYKVWFGELQELTPPPPADVADAVGDWCKLGDGRCPISQYVHEALQRSAGRIERDSGEVESQRLRDEVICADLEELRQRLAGGFHEPPVPPISRDQAFRAANVGAPLWQLCDFRDSLTESGRGNVEAALESSGILDAWVTVDGHVLTESGDDTVLVMGTSEVAPLDRQLLRILGPATDRAGGSSLVSDDVIAAVLQHVGFGKDSGRVWVAADGAWQNGPLHGKWSKPSPQYIGHDAREAQRKRRLIETQEEIRMVQDRLREADVKLAEFESRRKRLEHEVGAAPDDTAVHRAFAGVDSAGTVVDGLRRRQSDADGRVARHRDLVEAGRERRDADARDLRITEWVTRLQELDDGIGAYEKALAVIWPTVGNHISNRREASAAKVRAVDADALVKRRHAAHLEFRKKSEAAVAKRDALKNLVGSKVDEIRARFERAGETVKRIKSEREKQTENRIEYTTKVKVAESQIEAHQEDLAGHTQEREDAVAALRSFAASGLLSTALPDLDHDDSQAWSVSAAVDVARRIGADLSDVESDNPAWEGSQKGIHGHVQDLTNALLPHNVTPETTFEGDVFIVTAQFQGELCSMAELQKQLTDEITARQSILDARERQVLETYLIDEVASHLHDLIQEGEEWVHEMNAELEERPMSTGMTLRFKWEIVEDGPTGLREARQRLLSSGAMWSPDERAALGAFLQRQIQAQRMEDDTGTWQDHLAHAFDYRNWHRFSVERKQDGQWKRLTRRTHGTASGGEKAIALTVPQFAAAAAHYRSADPLAPRLILLDEAFVGVDTDMRAKCMGLLETFDLDFVMTSEREWGCYATLGDLAIYQLSTRPGIDAIGLTRWVWNGRQRLRCDQTLPPAARGDGAWSSTKPDDENGNGMLT